MTEQTIHNFNPREFVKNLPRKPGVYCMLDADGEILYVGKARALQARVSSYFRSGAHDAKTQAMISRVADIQVSVTRTEAEALLLENNLIKAHRPRYNVLLRDDKSYPYIYLNDVHPYPRMHFYRGVRRKDGRCFGPYPSASAVRATLKEMQRLFRIRQCTDGFFANRARPCLQYQIERCSAPCVGYISEDEYRRDVSHAVHFLEGRNSLVIDELAQRMDAAAQALEFERAAKYRDQIVRLQQLQAQQNVSGAQGDFDAVAVVIQGAQACVAVGFIRGGRHLGHKTFFPKSPDQTSAAEVCSAFLSQYYLQAEPPAEVLCEEAIEDHTMLEEALSEKAGRNIAIRTRVRGARRQWLDLARANAQQALVMRMSAKAGMLARMQALQEALGLAQLPRRLECFDISHTQGEATVASCVVFDQEGPRKSDYRRFNIDSITPGDDYAAMRQVLLRRYARLKREEVALPDVVFIDGGKGQLTQALEIFAELQIEGVQLVAIAKGPTRKPGLEQLILPEREPPLQLAADSAALHLIQQIRDEAHRFAITGHRAKRGKARTTSALEDIPGIGPKRRQQLLRQFGGLAQLHRAGVEDLARIPGISAHLAKQIYASLHADEA